ncbi:hypothetical protein TRAPUB_2540 [Trametes pubescens]|uniref:Uncharacterized protein n=1 Tax=Trametes pubescens TaxID=154538 RepID=A0A1M2VGF5_TRAPU|nr:hypothetical protein TRAPUB_2540 [Trametes pubescens]
MPYDDETQYGICAPKVKYEGTFARRSRAAVPIIINFLLDNVRGCRTSVADSSMTASELEKRESSMAMVDGWVIARAARPDSPAVLPQAREHPSRDEMKS